jgi:hypothetical protein
MARNRFLLLLLYIFQKYFKCENNSRKFLENVLKHEKYSNNLKNLGKFPETDWDMINPNKVFGAHEKDFRAF